MLDAAEVKPGERVLDIGCGTGEPAIPAAEHVGPTGRVVGIDLAPEMLAVARRKAAARGLSNVELREQRVESLEATGAFDVVLSRWGLMFAADAVASLLRARACLVPGGRIALACWTGPERDQWRAIPAEILERRGLLEPAPPGAPGMFALSDPARLRQVMEAGGFAGVKIEEVPVSAGGEFADGRAYFAWLRDLNMMMQRAWASLAAEARAEVEREVAEAVERLSPGGTVKLGGSTWVASARSVAASRLTELGLR